MEKGGEMGFCDCDEATGSTHSKRVSSLKLDRLSLKKSLDVAAIRVKKKNGTINFVINDLLDPLSCDRNGFFSTTSRS